MDNGHPKCVLSLSAVQDVVRIALTKPYVARIANLKPMTQLL
jgi:hypothetical protein